MTTVLLKRQGQIRSVILASLDAAASHVTPDLSRRRKDNAAIAKPAGFSLIELTVSLAILSLIITLLYGAFFQISNYALSLQKTMKTRQELRLLMKVVLDDLQSAQYLEHLVELNKADDRDSLYQSGILSKRLIGGPQNKEINSIHFHTAIPTRFFPEAIAQDKDPELHEVGYFLEESEEEKGKWLFKRREDFYLDHDITKGGRIHVLSEAIVGFELEFLQSQTKRQSLRGGLREEIEETWSKEYDSPEKNCTTRSSANSCLPLAIRLTMSLKGEDNKVIADTMEINLPISIQR